MRDDPTEVLKVVAAVLLGLNIWSIDARANNAVLGSLTVVGGEVRVDKVAAIPGTAVFEGDVIATGSKSGARIDLRSGTKVTVAEKSEVTLLYDTLNPGVELREGALVIQTDPVQASQVNTKFGTSFVLGSADGLPSLCRIASIGSEVAVLNEKGRVEIHGAGAPTLLPPGKYVVLQAGKPQAGLETAGKVTAAIPVEVVERQGAAAVPLHVTDPVYWQDLVTTERTGRVRIELAGGSVLNVGARSQMRIVKHDMATEQTELELGVGKLRGQIVKLTKPGASFTIKTQTAVVGVVGTELLVICEGGVTTVICLEGSVTVANVNPSIPGSVTLQPGQSTTVTVNGAPSPPVSVSPQTLQSLINQTNAQTGPGKSGFESLTSFAYIVFAGGTAGIFGATIGGLGDAANQFGNIHFNFPPGAFNSLNNLGSGWNALGCALDNLAQSEGVSPVYIPSGCYSCP